MSERLPGIGLSDYRRLCRLLDIPPTLEHGTPVERAASLPWWATAPWMSAELIETAPARCRLKRWAALDCPLVDPHQVAYVGDDDVFDACVSVLAQIPTPVVHHVVTTCVLVGIGRRSEGWHGPAPALPAPKYERLSFVAVKATSTLDDNELVTNAAHELAHAWCRLGYSVDEPLSTETHRQVLARSTHEGLLERVADGLAAEERFAARLARRWGFTGAGADARRCATATRRGVIEEARLHGDALS